MDLSKIASFITLEPSQLFRAERFVEQGLKMYNSDEELTEAYLKENLHGVTLDYAMHVLDESSTSYMDVAIHNQGGKFSAPTAGVYGVSSRPEIKQKIKDKVLKRNELEKKQRKLSKEEIELDELYKGKHGQSEKEYQDSRSDGGKMVSGDSKGSGASYATRSMKGTGPNPAGGSKKPQGQGRMTSGARTELQFRKAALKKKANEEVEIVNEEDYDRMKDRQMERGTFRPRSKPGVARSGGSQPKPMPQKKSGMSAFDKVAGDLKKKYGDNAIITSKRTVKKEEVESLEEKKMSKAAHKKAAKAGKRWQDSDGDGKWYEPGQDVKKEEVINLSDSLSLVEGKVACKKCKGKGCDDCKGKGYKVTHNCSSKVEHAEWGKGECIKEMHTLDENGRISHYDVIFAHGIEENVSVHDLTTLVSEMHEHAINDEKNEVVESMKQARKNVGASKCWKGYKAQGTKTKDGKVVPNCVKEEVEQYVDFLIDEGYDCSELTWDEISEEYDSLDEGLRSAVKKLFGKKDAPAANKPESRGDQLRKKYNVGPEKSDTSAKMKILQKTRAKKERDQKEFGGSRYSKSVAKKSADAHDRYLKGGYSKYGADDARGKGNKAAKRAAALRKEEIDEAMVQVKGKKKGNVIINPEVKKVNEDADVAKKQQVQRKQLMLNKQKLALQQKATTKKKPTDMHMEETEDIQEVDTTTRSVDYGQEIENTALKRKKEKKSLTDFKKLSKPKES